MSNNVYAIVTDRILGLLKKGVVPWKKPWNVRGRRTPMNLVSGKPYRGINVFLLACSEFRSPWFLTFNQVRRLGGSVRKGSRGFPVTFWKILERKDEAGKVIDRIRLLRYYVVFNVEQTQGIEHPDVEAPATFNPIESAEKVVAGLPSPRPAIHHDGGDRAYYASRTDSVHMPARDFFATSAEYYSTLFHEISHASGHKDRLDRRDLKAYSVQDGARPREELTAEMGAAFLCAHCGIERATLENSAAYVANWLRELESDPRLVVLAAGQAQKAADWILGKGKEDKETEEEADVGASESPSVVVASMVHADDRTLVA